MPVEIVTTSQGIGGGLGPTSFSDPLNVADPIDASGAMGSNWITKLCNPANTSALTWATPNVSAVNKLTLATTSQAAPLTAQRTVLIPIPILRSNYGKTQFVQATVVTLAGGVNDVTGIGVLGYHSDINLTGYTWGIRGDGSWTMYRFNAETPTSLASGAAGAIVNGNVVRMSGDVSVANQVTIILSIAGTVVSTTVDNAAAIVTVGTQFIHCVVAQAAGNTTWSTFSCGLGT